MSSPTGSLKHLLPYMQDLVALLDGQGRMVELSPALARLLYPEGMPQHSPRLVDCLCGPEVPVWGHEHWQTCQLRDGSGRLHDLQIRIVPREDDTAGHVVHFRQPEPAGYFNHALQRVFANTAAHVGQQFLDQVLRQITRELVVEGAFLAVLDDHAERFRLRSRFLPTDLELDLEWLNSRVALLRANCCRIDSASCPDMARAGVDVIKTVPLRSGDGYHWGVLGILDSNRHSLPAWTEDLLLMMASRCVSELERLRDQQRMEQLAYQDSLTELPNRLRFREQVDELLADPDRCQGSSLLFLDLDRFKIINDSLGHHCGDRLLQLAARRVSRMLDASSRAYRISGDEFAILVADQAALQPLLDRLLLGFERPFQVDGQSVQSSVSIGVACWRPEYQSAHDWLRDADQAMYAAKRQLQNQVAYFDNAMWRRSRERSRLQRMMQSAWKNDEMRVLLQPVHRLDGSGLAGFEALIRWQHPQLGLIGPDRFVPLCEESGGILKLDRWVFDRVCRQLAGWKQYLGPDCLLPVNVNVSSIHADQADFAEYYLAALARHDLDPALIHVEITETALMDDRARVSSQLQRLREHGVKVVVDDFGMGYSSLGRLRHLPVDALKIDRSFVQSMLNCDEEMEVVWAIVTLAHNLNKEIVAEGIENREQLELLTTMRCDYGQGFMLGKPLEMGRAESLLFERAQAELCSRAG